MKGFATCVHRLRWGSQHDCGLPRRRPSTRRQQHAATQKIKTTRARTSEARTQPCATRRAGRHPLFHPIVPASKRNCTTHLSLSNTPYSDDGEQRSKIKLTGSVKKKFSLCWCRNVFALSDLRWKLAVSLEGAMSSFPLALGCSGISGSKKGEVGKCFG